MLISNGVNSKSVIFILKKEEAQVWMIDWMTKWDDRLDDQMKCIKDKEGKVLVEKV